MNNLILEKIFLTGQKVYSSLSCSNIFQSWMIKSWTCSGCLDSSAMLQIFCSTESSPTVFLILVNSIIVLILCIALSSTQRKNGIFKEEICLAFCAHNNHQSIHSAHDKIMPSPENRLLVHTWRASGDLTISLSWCFVNLVSMVLIGSL